MFEIDESFIRPESFSQLIPSDHLARVFQQDSQNLEGLSGHTEAKTVFAQLTGWEICLKYPEPHEHSTALTHGVKREYFITRPGCRWVISEIIVN